MNKTEYLQPFIDSINQTNQITHLCIKNIDSNCITQEFIDFIKNEFDITITLIPFNPILFENENDEDYTKSGSDSPTKLAKGLYILLDSSNVHNIMKYICIIQNKIRTSLENKNISWILHYLSHKRHKWIGTSYRKIII